MADPITLTAVGVVVLNEGIKFLYGQVGDLLKRRRERKEKEAAAAATAQASAAPGKEAVPAVAVPAADVLEGRLAPPVADFDKLEPLAESMTALRRDLGDYAEGLSSVDPCNSVLMTKVDTLRRQLEAVLGQRITFKGEQRPATGSPVVVGEVDVRSLAGEAAGVAAGRITSGDVSGKAKADTVEQTGKLYGVKADEIGGT